MSRVVPNEMRVTAGNVLPLRPHRKVRYPGVVSDEDVEFADRAAIEIRAPYPDEWETAVPELRRFEIGDPPAEVLDRIRQGDRSNELDEASGLPGHRIKRIRKFDERFAFVQRFAAGPRPA